MLPTMRGVAVSPLLRECQRTERALSRESLKDAVLLVKTIHNYTTTALRQWALGNGLHETTSISFFPLRREGEDASITVAVAKEGASAKLKSMGFDVIKKYGMFFVALDKFEWSAATHSSFVDGKLFGVATEQLSWLGAKDLLVPIVLLQGRGLVLKHHVPQPELNDGTRNPQFCEKNVWTISTSDETPPEVLKFGKLAGMVIVMPWNPSARDVCMQDSEIENWAFIKNLHFGAAHFALGEPVTLLRGCGCEPAEPTSSIPEQTRKRKAADAELSEPAKCKPAK